MILSEKYLPNLQQFAAPEFPEPEVVSLCITVIRDFFFPSISFSSYSLNFHHSFLQQRDPCLNHMLGGKKLLPFTTFEPATCSKVLVWADAVDNYSLITLCTRNP